MVDEDVSRLDVPVHDVDLVQKVQCTQQIVHDGYNVVLGQGGTAQILEHALEVDAEALLHEVDVVELQLATLVTPERHNLDIMEFDSENVTLDFRQLFHYLYFPEDFLGLVRTVKDVLDELDGAYCSLGAPPGRHHLAKGALTKRLDDLEVFLYVLPGA